MLERKKYTRKSTRINHYTEPQSTLTANPGHDPSVSISVHSSAGSILQRDNCVLARAISRSLRNYHAPDLVARSQLTHFTRGFDPADRDAHMVHHAINGFRQSHSPGSVKKFEHRCMVQSLACGKVKPL